MKAEAARKLVGLSVELLDLDKGEWVRGTIQIATALMILDRLEEAGFTVTDEDVFPPGAEAPIGQ